MACFFFCSFIDRCWDWYCNCDWIFYFSFDISHCISWLIILFLFIYLFSLILFLFIFIYFYLFLFIFIYFYLFLFILETTLLGKLPGLHAYRSVKRFPNTLVNPSIAIVRVDAILCFLNQSFTSKFFRDLLTKKQNEKIQVIVMDWSPINSIGKKN